MTTRFAGHLLVGDHASRPAFGAVPEGTLYSCTDHGLVYQSDGVAAWSTWAAITGGVPGAHATSHQNGGSDEVSVAGLSGLLADDQNPTAHAADHQNGGGDEINVTGLSGMLADGQTPLAHKTSHENGGSDEISVVGLSGLLADGQTPIAHKTSHENGGSDEISVAGLSGALADAQPVAVHKNGTIVGTRKNINLIEGTNVTLTVTDDAGDDEVDVEIAAAGGGSSVIVQVKNTQTGAVASGTPVIPVDDTIPQNTEGTEFLTLAITPTNAAHILRIDVKLMIAPSNINWISAALFQDSAAGALAAISEFGSSATGSVSLAFTHYMVAGTTSATTFKVRAGTNAAGTATLNGVGGAGRLFGGVAVSSITISEIVP